MNLAETFAFSQSSLQDYVDCARRFELRYIQDIRYPALQAEPALEHEEHMRKGAQFHKMVQQHILGVPADVLAKTVADDEILSGWWGKFVESGLKDVPENRHTEITLETDIGDYRLIAKYDLLAVEADGRALIIDWKTSAGASKRDWLEKRLQTIVYRYVLAQAGAHLNGGLPIKPENIRMIYWFVAQDGQSVTLDYSVGQMQADEAYLLKLMNDIQQANLFPLTSDERHCKFCTYRSLCNRGVEAGDWETMLDEVEVPASDEEFEIDFDQIAEIEF